MDYYKIISISWPILARANMGLDFVSGQYGCLFSRCRKYVINSLNHGQFHIGLVIIPRPPYRPIWKCPCINLYIYQQWPIMTTCYFQSAVTKHDNLLLSTSSAETWQRVTFNQQWRNMTTCYFQSAVMKHDNLLLSTSRNCLPFRSTWVHPRLLVGFVLFDL